jgi:hypothetical protein
MQNACQTVSPPTCREIGTRIPQVVSQIVPKIVFGVSFRNTPIMQRNKEKIRFKGRFRMEPIGPGHFPLPDKSSLRRSSGFPLKKI